MSLWLRVRGARTILGAMVLTLIGLALPGSAVAALAVGTTSVAALPMHQAGLALAGSIAARDVLVYLGFMLLAYPLAGWWVATMIPTIYLLAVAVIGRGQDISHPAWWAWIAADGGDQSSWVVTIALLGAGIGAYLTVRPRTSGMPAEE